MIPAQNSAPAGGGPIWVYRKNVLLPAITSSIALVVLTLVIVSKHLPYTHIILPVAVILGGLPVVLEFRTSISISADSLDYTWRSGRTESIDVARIARVEQEKTLYWLSVGRPVVVPGLRLMLKSGETRIFPLDFPDREEIVGRLRDLVGPSLPTA